MTDIDHTDDAWAGHVFDRARTSLDEPHWIPDAAAAARIGNRRRTWHRAGGAAGLAAVVGLSATVYGTLGGSDRSADRSGTGATPGTASTSPSWPTAREKELAETIGDHFFVTMGGGPANGDFSHPGTVRIPDRAAENLASLLKVLDPDGRHLRPVERGPKTVGPSENWMTSSVWAAGAWTPDGSTDLLAHEDPRAKSTAFGQVGVYIWSPGSLGRTGNVPCDIWANGVDPEMHITWSACDKHELADGSYVVTSHSTNLPARIILADRVFADGGRVTVAVSDTQVYDHSVNDHTTALWGLLNPGFVWGKSVDPMPWTEKGLADALAAPDIKELPVPKRPANPPTPQKPADIGTLPSSLVLATPPKAAH
ncbi:hypothetical protein [Catenulispora subtropica]|uniref:Uncharacterized protein n=1 Tax=Catenulispora subtropica TaxID=450798 RepID=A0ABP5BTK0_9ACTN